jgi:hypothetical protein
MLKHMLYPYPVYAYILLVLCYYDSINRTIPLLNLILEKKKQKPHAWVIYRWEATSDLFWGLWLTLSWLIILASQKYSSNDIVW